jgi:hypothetical protein
MKKLRLRLDDLRVDSFRTTEAQKVRGTVLGHFPLTAATACTCPGINTCDFASCGGTCAWAETCAAPCTQPSGCGPNPDGCN